MKLNYWQRFREFMGWHKPSDTAGITYDEVNTHSICMYCRKPIMQDSQGNWF